MILGTGQILIIFLFSGLCWLLVKWKIVLLSFFLAWTRETVWQNSENILLLKQNNIAEKSVAHIKVTFCFQIQVHGIEENIERQ